MKNRQSMQWIKVYLPDDVSDQLHSQYPDLDHNNLVLATLRAALGLTSIRAGSKLV